MLNWAMTHNFTDSAVLLAWLKNLVILFCILFTFYLNSFFLLRKAQFHNESEKLFFRVITGLTLFCFISLPFFLLNIYTVYTALALILFPWLAGMLIQPADFRKDLLNFFALLKPHLTALGVLTATSYIALLPPYRYDEMGYHLAYVAEFARHSGIITDPGMRLPLFTFNWHVVQTGMYLIGNYQLCHFLTWSASALTSLGIYSFLKRLEVKSFIAGLASFSFFFTPLVFRYSMVAYNDVPLMLFLLSSVYSLFVVANINNSIGTKDSTTIFISVLCCSMFAGMKIINIVYIPVFIVLLFFWARDARKHLLLFSLLFISLSSVWYIRNIVIDGDPVPPALNYALGKQDSFWTKEDYAAISQDVMPKNTEGIIRYLKLPWLMVSASPEKLLRDFPVFAYALFLPFIFIFALIHFRKKEFIFWGLASFAILLWLGTSYLIRYAHFMALLVIAAAFIINQLYGLVEKRPFFVKGILMLFILVIFFGPGYAALRYSFGNLNVRVPTTETDNASFATYGRPDLIMSVNELKNYGVEDNSKIYTFGLGQYKYYFIRKGYQVVGDAVNQFRYKDFISALQAGRLTNFLNESGVKVVYVDKSALSDYPGSETALTAIIAGKTFKQAIDKGRFWILVL